MDFRKIRDLCVEIAAYYKKPINPREQFFHLYQPWHKLLDIHLGPKIITPEEQTKRVIIPFWTFEDCEKFFVEQGWSGLRIHRSKEFIWLGVNGHREKKVVSIKPGKATTIHEAALQVVLKILKGEEDGTMS